VAECGSAALCITLTTVGRVSRVRVMVRVKSGGCCSKWLPCYFSVSVQYVCKMLFTGFHWEIILTIVTLRCRCARHGQMKIWLISASDYRREPFLCTFYKSDMTVTSIFSVVTTVNFHCHCNGWLPPNQHHHLGVLQCSRSTYLFLIYNVCCLFIMWNVNDVNCLCLYFCC